MLPIAFLFVSREDYPEFLSVFIDRDQYPSDYDGWLEKINQFCEHVKTDGGSTAQINCKPSELVEWCAANNRRCDTQARSAYAAFKYFHLQKQSGAH